MSRIEIGVIHKAGELGPVRPVLGSLEVLGRALMVLGRPEVVLGRRKTVLGITKRPGPSQVVLDQESHLISQLEPYRVEGAFRNWRASNHVSSLIRFAVTGRSIF